MRRMSFRRLTMAVLVPAVITLAAPAVRADPDFAVAGPEAVALLQGAVRIDTSNPPGDTTAIAAYYAEHLRAAGLEPTVVESEPGQVHVLARLRGDGSGPPVLLLNHMDVVAAEADEWDHPPFAAEIHEGRLYGRGTLDMKGLGVLQLEVMRLLARQGVALKRDVIFYGAPDEEAGGARGAEWMAAHRWADVDAAYVLNEGASGRRDMFGAGSRVYFVQTAEKGVCWLRVTARGTSGHGSQPTPDNANLYLLRALARMTAYDTPVRLVPTVAKGLEQLATVIGGEDGALWARAGDPAMLPQLVPSLLAHDMFKPRVRTTINLTGLQSGYKINVNPATATATLDCRILPGDSPEQLLAQLQALAYDEEAAVQDRELAAKLERPLTPEESRQVSFEWVLKGSATESSMESPVYRAIMDVLGEVDPGVPVVPQMSAGGTDSRFWRERGIDAYGFEPYMLTPDQHTGVHGKNEYIEVADYQRALEIYYEVVRRVVTAAPATDG